MINIVIVLETFLSARCDKDYVNTLSIFLTWPLHRRWHISCIFFNDSNWICKATSLKLCFVGFLSLTISTPAITVFIRTRDARTLCLCFCDMRCTPHNHQYYYTFLPPRKTGIHISGRCLWEGGSPLTEILFCLARRHDRVKIRKLPEFAILYHQGTRGKSEFRKPERNYDILKFIFPTVIWR